MLVRSWGSRAEQNLPSVNYIMWHKHFHWSQMQTWASFSRPSVSEYLTTDACSLCGVLEPGCACENTRTTMKRINVPHRTQRPAGTVGFRRGDPCCKNDYLLVVCGMRCRTAGGMTDFKLPRQSPYNISAECLLTDYVQERTDRSFCCNVMNATAPKCSDWLRIPWHR